MEKYHIFFFITARYSFVSILFSDCIFCILFSVCYYWAAILCMLLRDILSPLQLSPIHINDIVTTKWMALYLVNNDDKGDETATQSNSQRCDSLYSQCQISEENRSNIILSSDPCLLFPEQHIESNPVVWCHNIAAILYAVLGTIKKGHWKGCCCYNFLLVNNEGGMALIGMLWPLQPADRCECQESDPHLSDIDGLSDSNSWKISLNNR